MSYRSALVCKGDEYPLVPRKADHSHFQARPVSARSWTLTRTLLMALLSLVYASTARAQIDVQSLSGRQTPYRVLDGTAKMLGHYNPGQTLRVVFGLQPPHMAEEEQFLKDLQTKGSPRYHHFLTAEEWNARFAPSAQDEQAVVDWAESQGMKVSHRYPNRLLVDVEAPAGAFEKALNLNINNYQLGAASFFSNDADPIIPASLTNIVHSVGGLNNLQVLHPSNRGVKEPAFAQYVPGPVVAAGKSGSHGADRTKLPAALAKSLAASPTPGLTGGAYDPTDMFSSQAYDTNGLYALGHCCNPLHNPGVTPPETSIAIATAGTQDGNDFAGFHNQYPYLADHWQQFYIDGTPSCCDGEGTMDMEWATAMSNSFGSYVDTAMIYLYDGVNANFSTFNDIYNQILNDGKARVFSSSWGCAEFDCTSQATMDTDHAIFNQMIGQGWTLVGISHDGGATASCVGHDAVSYPGSDPDVVSAGGTTLYLNGDSTFNSEVAWSGGPGGCGTNDGGSGGGFSAYYPTPWYQSGLNVGSRAVPDISLNADWWNTPQNIFFNGSLSGNGGTSIVAPQLAGFFANENAYLLYLSTITGGLCNGHGCAPMGNANPYLYWFGLNPGYAPHYPYYDITSGCNNNDVTASLGLGYYCAGTGYDEVTGWGNPNMLQLAWAINTYQAGDFGAPYATFSGPTTNQWYNTDQTVSWTLTDTTADGLPATGVAGFSQAWDTDPGNVFSEATPGAGNSYYSGPQFPNATSGSLNLSWAGSQGCHTVNIRAWDNTGYPSGDLTYGPLCYDTVTPSTSASLLPLANGYGWDKANVQVSLKASDPGAGSGTGSGVAATYYLVDANFCLFVCPVYSGPISITSEAKHTVRYWTKDVAGNFESSHTIAVNIDKTAPHTSATLSGNMVVTLTRTDSLSGVVSTVYQIDGGAAQTYTAPFTVSKPGSHTVAFHSTDYAGNVETTQSVGFIVKAGTATAVASSLNPSAFGKVVIFTATVSSGSGTPTGTVTFKNGASVLGTIALSLGKALLATSALSVGTHSITASYGGGTNFLGSTSPTLAETVNKAGTNTSVVSSLNPSTFGKVVTFTATVSSGSGTPMGTVTFKNGASVLGTVALSLGKAMFATSSLSVGTHSITAAYGGGTNFNASTSGALSEVVNKAASSTAVSSSVNPSSFNQSVTFTAKVKSATTGIPAGNVTFKNGTVVLGTVALNSSGVATFTTSSLSLGSHSITANYAGGTNFTSSASAVLTQTVNKAATTALIASSLNPSVRGKAVTFTVTVKPAFGGTPTGTVTFKNGTAVLGTGALNTTTHQASFVSSGLTVGTHSMTAVYGGDAHFNPVTSPVLSQVVNP